MEEMPIVKASYIVTQVIEANWARRNEFLATRGTVNIHLSLSWDYKLWEWLYQTLDKNIHLL